MHQRQRASRCDFEHSAVAGGSAINCCPPETSVVRQDQAAFWVGTCCNAEGIQHSLDTRRSNAENRPVRESTTLARRSIELAVGALDQRTIRRNHTVIG